MLNSKTVVSAILLAAGEARRMGRPKLLMPLASGTVLEQTIDNLLASKVEEIIVVLGAKSEDLKQVITNRPVQVVVNPDYEQGMSTSLIAGLSLVDNRAQWIMIALADQPFIDSDTYNKLIETSLSGSNGIIVPTYRGRRGNPVIFSARYKPELYKLKGDIGGRELLQKYSADVLEVAAYSEGIHSDIDTRDDYLRLAHR